MNECPLCSRAVSGPTCACGASIDWLARAPMMLREKLASGVRRSIGVATVSALIGCSGGACAPSDGGADGAPVDVGTDTGADR
jgi:hypothetical protein